MRKAKGYVWEVRFSEWLNGKRFQRTMRFQGTEYPKEADVRKAIELTVSQINSGTAGEKADAKFGAIITLYRRKFLPSGRRLLELKKRLHKVFPAGGALIDAFTVAREDELDEIDLMLKAPATPENINLLAQRLAVPNAPELEFSTREHHAYLLDHYIEPRFANVPIREMKVLMIDEWLLSPRDEDEYMIFRGDVVAALYRRRAWLAASVSCIRVPFPSHRLRHSSHNRCQTTTSSPWSKLRRF